MSFRKNVAHSYSAFAFFSIVLWPSLSEAGSFFETQPEGRSSSPSSRVPEQTLSRLKPDNSGRVFIGDMAFNLERLGRLGFNGRKWPQGVVPIAFHDNVSEYNRRRFFDACALWSDIAAIKCIPRTTQVNYVRVHSGSGNWSEVGMQGGMQELELVDWAFPMTIAHEIAHALGAGHEQSRQDRDQFVTIVRERIQPGREGNFAKLPLQSYTAYDFESIMHYPPTAFSINGAATIVPKPGYEHYASVMGNSSRLSEGDKISMRRQYGTPTGAMPLAGVAGSDAARNAGEPDEPIQDLNEDIRFRTNSAGADSKVFDGTPVTGNKFSDVVGVSSEFSEGLRCTGTLIQRDIVLTAAHCVCADISGSIFIGSALSTGGRRIAVKRSAHGLRSCSQPLREGLDLAVLLLDQPVEGVEPRKIASDDTVTGAKSYRVMGFGAIDQDASVFPQEKREAVVPAVSNACDGTVSNRSDQKAYGCQPGQEIVAGRKGSPDSCSGDSGGPLFVSSQRTGLAAAESDYVLAGVTSRASSASQRLCGEGGVYERLNSASRAWIDQNIATLRQ